MRFHCKELSKTFESKKELIKELVLRLDEVTELKKSAVKFSDPTPFQIIGKSEVLKSLTPTEQITYGSIVYPVINTTNYLDSHSDVHLPGIWKKSIKEQKGKIYLIVNHDLEIGKIISQPKDVEAFTQVMEWKELGANFEGETEALIFKSKLSERSNVDGFNAYKFNDPVQHSIRMIYDKMYLCVDPEMDDDADMAAYNENWEKYITQVINADKAKEQGYFWAITEARIFKEGSMVIAGSNDVTPTLYDLDKSLKGTLDNESQGGTQTLTKEQINQIFSFKI